MQAEVTPPETADSFLKASHVSRTQHAHQVTVSALDILMHKAYDCYCENFPEGVEPLAFSPWRVQRDAESPQFLYWSLTMKFQLTILIFVRSLREGNFLMYKEACTALAPWFLSLNHTNYARWLPVDIRDMISLEKEIPSYLDSCQRQLNSKQSESRFQHKARKVETDCRDKSTTSSSTGGVEQTKVAKIETETILQRAERLEVLGNSKNERLRRRQDYNEQSDSRS